MTVPEGPHVSGVPERSYRWVMLGLICLLYGSFGLVSQSLSPVLGRIADDLDMSRGLMGTVLGLWPLTYLLVAIPAGALIDRFGVRYTLLSGALLILLSQLLRAAAFHPAILAAGVIVFGVGGPFVSIGAPKVAASWFSPADAGVALGIYTVSPQLGSFVAVAGTNTLIMPRVEESWRIALLVLAIVPGVASLAWFAFSRDASATTSTDRADFTPRAEFSRFQGIVRLPGVRTVLLLTAGTFFVNHSLGNWLPEMLQARGLSPSAAGLMASIPTLVAVPAAIALPRIATARSLPILQGLLLTGWALSMILVAFGDTFSLYIGLIVIGVGRGAVAALLMLVLVRSLKVDPLLVGAAAGLFFTAGEVGGVLGPTVVGVLSQATGGFEVVLASLAIVSSAMAALAWSQLRRSPTRLR